MEVQIILEAAVAEIRCMNRELAKLRDDINIMSDKISVLEKNNKEVETILTKHIGFVDGKYEYYKGSLDYIKDKVNYLNYLNPIWYLTTPPTGFAAIEDS